MHKAWLKVFGVVATASLLACDPATASKEEETSPNDYDDELAVDVKDALVALGNPRVLGIGAAGLPSFLAGSLGAAGTSGAEAALRPALNKIAPAFRLLGDELELLGVDRDAVGQLHFRFAQKKGSARVVGGELLIHVDATGGIFAVNGSAHGSRSLSSAPTITADAAAAKTRALFSDKTNLELGTPTLTYAIGSDDKIHLVYEVLAEGSESDGLPLRTVAYIDALSGEVASQHPKIHTALKRAVHSANHSETLPGALKRAEGAAATGIANVDGNYDHLGSVYAFFSKNFGRDSYDGKGAALTSTVDYKNKYVNAFWNGEQMVYGNGDGKNASDLALALDVTAHELSHAVTEYSSGLVYLFEPGAVNEALSDIFGASVEAFTKLGRDRFDANTFIIGEDIWTPATPGDGLRYMDNPTKDEVSCDYYSERFKCFLLESNNGGVHLNSGIPNLAWSLLVKGGKHPRNKNNVVVTALGIEKATAIFYRANTKYLTSNSGFRTLRTATVQSAQDLYGADAAAAVNQTWDAVGVPKK